MRASRRTTSSAPPTASSVVRPVMLATFDVPLDPGAAAFAVDTAVESGQPLIVVNAVELSVRPMTLSWGAEVVVTDDVERTLREPAELARALAVDVDRIRLVSPRPVAALLELVAERRPGLLVVGPDARRISRRRLARISKRVRDAPCLVWSTADSAP